MHHEMPAMADPAETGIVLQHAVALKTIQLPQPVGARAFAHVHHQLLDAKHLGTLDDFPECQIHQSPAAKPPCRNPLADFGAVAAIGHARDAQQRHESRLAVHAHQKGMAIA